MTAKNLAKPKAHLSELVELAATGKPQIIMRRGKPVAQIVAIEPKHKPIDHARLRSLTDSMTTGREVITQTREETRY